jgi:hypothetical protein
MISLLRNSSDSPGSRGAVAAPRRQESWPASNFGQHHCSSTRAGSVAPQAAAGVTAARSQAARELVRRARPRSWAFPSSKRSPKRRAPREIQQLSIGASTAPGYPARDPTPGHHPRARKGARHTLKTCSRTKSRNANPDDYRSARFSRYASWQWRQPTPGRGRNPASIGCW